MAAALAHRGPDGDGVESVHDGDGPAAVLGHRRLSIIDPTPRGAQPMSYAGGRYWITYNGELYNFRELRTELESRGHSFRSDCDTEVLLAMYAEYGQEMLERLNGIFAFAIWDRSRRELFLARDRLGVKPLYWAQRGDTLAFASEVKALLPALGRPRLRRDVVPQFLTFLWVPDPDTLFEGVYKLYSAVSQLSFNRFEEVTFTSVETEGSVTSERLEGKIGRVRTSSAIQPSLASRGVQRVAPHGTVKVEVSLEPFGGGPSIPVTFTMRAPGRPGFYDVRLRGGRDRFFSNDRGIRSLDQLLNALSGGEHGNDLIATGLGRRVTTSADLMVTGRRSLTVQVVR